MGLTTCIHHHHYMEDAIAIVSAKLLTDRIASSYPCVNPELCPSDKFSVRQADEYGRLEEYIVSDADLVLDIQIPTPWLKDSDFNLVGWYRRHLGQQGNFEESYRSTCLRLYINLAVPAPGQGVATSYIVPDPVIGTSTSEPEADWDEMPELAVLPFTESVSDHVKETPDSEVSYEDLPQLEALSDDEGKDEKPEHPLMGLTSIPLIYQNEDAFIDPISRVLTQMSAVPWGWTTRRSHLSSGGLSFCL